MSTTYDEVHAEATADWLAHRAELLADLRDEADERPPEWDDDGQLVDLVDRFEAGMYDEVAP